MLDVALESNPSTGYVWLVTENDGSVLRLNTDRDFTPDSDMTGAPGIQHSVYRALTRGAVKLVIGLFPPGADKPEQTFTLDVKVE